ncbi:MAG: flavin-containing monooxygenase [Alphaproteobacteria bacterium]
MTDQPDAAAEAPIAAWIARFEAALATGQAAALRPLFRADSHWRDLVGLSWTIMTVSGRDRLAGALARYGAAAGARAFAIDRDRCPPRVVERAGVPVAEAILRFETATGIGAGLVRLRLDEAESPDAAPAWTLLTTLEEIKGHEEATLRAQADDGALERQLHGPNWLDRRRAAAAYDGRDPAVLVVGAGHAGLTIAARLGQLGVDTLVVDRQERLGDNWRRRYRGLKLHNQVHSNHLPYMPFPPTWPLYLPKDKIANWLEIYAECMEIDAWMQTAFEGAEYDGGRWTARLRRADGTLRILHPRHIVMATSVSGAPNLPDIPTLDRFAGPVVHSSGFGDGARWRDRDVLVFGTGTSAHDIAQDLHGHGARVTMVQRSPTLVVNIEPSAQIYDGVYLGEGPSLDDRDLINASFPLPLTKASHRRITEQAIAHDRPLLDGLERAGFELDFGEDRTGWPLKYRQRGGGYYFNVGCSDLIADGRIGLVQYRDVAAFESGGLRMAGGRFLPADLVVLATGYKGPGYLVESLFGAEIAARIGPVWGFDDAAQELRNMWVRTRQPGLWFTAGAFSQCRIYSKYLARQIKAVELGLIAGEVM